MRSWWLVVLTLIASCVRSNAVPCSDGSWCAEGTTCDVANNRCLSPEAVAACDGVAEGTPCVLDGRNGACRAGACEAYYCGDDYVAGAERCDGNNLGISVLGGDATCLDAGFYAPDGLACLPTCAYDLSGCELNGGGRCGDLIVNGPELCDGPTDRTCIAIGFDAGNVSCTTECGFAIRDCTRFGWNPEALPGLVALTVGGSGPDDQWAAGSDGLVMRYEGAFWNPYPTPVSNPLIAVAGVSPTDAWIVGADTLNPVRPSVLLRWDGTSWATVPAAPAAQYVDVWAAASDRVYFASRDLGVQQWNGSSWQAVGAITGTPITIRGSTLNGVDDLWVATEEGPLLRWIGSTWQPATPPNARIRSLDANAADDVWAVGADDVSPANGVIAHWDGVQWTTWRRQTIYGSVASSGPSDAWIAVADDTMIHWDGTAWSSTLPIGASSSGLAAVSGLVSFGANEVLAVSTLNLAYRYRGMAFGRPPQLPTSDQNIATWRTAADDLYIGNVKGNVYHYDGTSWTVVFTIPELMVGTPVAVSSLWGSGPADVYVTATDGRVFRWNGTTWAPDGQAGGNVVWGSDPGEVWTFGTAGAFHRTGGATWTRHALDGRWVRSVSGSGADDIYAVTDAIPNGSLWHWDGVSWSQLAHGATRPINAVVAPARDLVFVAADDGRIARWDGTSWTEATVPAGAELRFLVATARDDVIAASERELFHYDGRQWSPMRPPVDFVPNTPDYLPMTALHASPGRIDLLLQRLKLRTLIRTRPVACRGQEQSCSNAIDDDCDGQVDAGDTECP